MTYLKNTYALQAFPSEKLLKEFLPERGMAFSGEITANSHDLAIAENLHANAMMDPKAWKNTGFIVELRPIFERIAQHMGYELKSLLEGNGETGLAGHSWTIYADPGQGPMLIRWNIEDAQMLLAIDYGPRSLCPNSVNLYLLGDKKALTHLQSIGALLREIETPQDKAPTMELPVGNTVQKIELADGGTFFDVYCTLYVDDETGANELRAKEYAELMNSVNVIVDTPATGGLGREMKMELNEIRVVGIFKCGQIFRYTEHKPISWEIIQHIHARSVQRVRELMTKMLQRHLRAEEDSDRAVEINAQSEKGPDAASAERILKHAMNCQAIHQPEGVDVMRLGFNPQTFEQLHGKLPTLGEAFVWTPWHTLLGTEGQLAMRGGDVAPSVDLLSYLFRCFIRELSRAYPTGRVSKAKIKLQGRMMGNAIADNYRDTAATNFRFQDLATPFYSAHRGLPVRIDKSLVVWRANDTEALAADFFYAPESRDLHVANLYRVKVPQG